MKVRYWMTVYPYQMNGYVNPAHKPMVSSTPPSDPEPDSSSAKVLTFEVDVPDGLFGVAEISASVPEVAK